MSSIFDSYLTAFHYLGQYWWAWIPLSLIAGTISAYESYLKHKYFASLAWITLEIRIPQELRKSPKFTEQMFAGFHGMWFPLDWKDKWINGKFDQDFLSFEIIARGGSITFFVRTPSRYKHLVESHIYAQYPDAEIAEVQDFTLDLPKSVPDQEHDLWGTELILTKDDAYPIRTYPEFEESGGIGEEKRVDPLAALAEALGGLKAGEQAWLQYLIRPTVEDHWIKKGKAIIDKMMGREKQPAPGALGKAVDIIGLILPEALSPAAGPKDKKEQKTTQHLSPGEKDIAVAIDRKVAKIAFKCGIRFVYFARREVFNLGVLGAVIGAFKQFASSNLNGFRINAKTFTSDNGILGKILPGRGLFADRLFYSRKVKIYRKFRRREPVKKWFFFNTEELATIYHLPTISVRAPSVPRIHAKKGMPPVGLPTE